MWLASKSLCIFYNFESWYDVWAFLKLFYRSSIYNNWSLTRTYVCLFKERLLKPLSAFIGMTGEMRELATVVSKVRSDFCFIYIEILVIFVIWECCLFLFVNADSACSLRCKPFFFKYVTIWKSFFICETMFYSYTK